MFTLRDGRECLWQWDLDRQILISDPTVTEVHFCNRTDDCSLVVDVVDSIANIPNILLQDAYPIRVYAYCSNYTKVEHLFKVHERTKPADYVYTETEVRTYNSLDERLSELETKTSNIDSYTTKEYVDSEDDALKAYVDEKLANIDISGIDIPTKVSQLENDAGYISELPAYILTEGEASITYARIDDLDWVKADIQDMKSTYATQAYVQNYVNTAISNIGNGEETAY